MSKESEVNKVLDIFLLTLIKNLILGVNHK